MATSSIVSPSPVSLPVLGGAPAAAEAIVHKKAPVAAEALAYKNLQSGPFWQAIPAYKDVDETTFLDHNWQAKHSITRVDKLLAAVQDLVSPEFLRDAEEGFKRAPMSVRVSPYMLSLIDWSNPYEAHSVFAARVAGPWRPSDAPPRHAP